MRYDADYKTNVLNRWKSIEGHAAAVRRMLESDTYCPDVLRQALAVQGAIDRVNALILANHLQTCASEALRGDDEAAREQVIGELLELFSAGSHVTWTRQLPAFGDLAEAGTAGGA